ncbi:MAG: methyltransferase domain-containing protein [Gammaproteobacteria bacterium]
MKSFCGQVNPEYLNKAATLFSAVKQGSYGKMRIAQGDTVLDVGCGPGIDVMALSEHVGKHGKVIGFDHDPTMLNQALQNIGRNCEGRDVAFVQGCAGQLPFQDSYFSSCRSERLFMHLKAPEQALSEMVRVTQPGGKIVILDTDWASLSIDNPLPKIEQALSNYRVAQVLNNGYSGRSLYRQVKGLQLSNIAIEVSAVCVTDLELFYYLSMQQAVEDQALANRVVTERELKYWREELNQAAENDCFYCTVNMVTISADKPNSNTRH